MPAGARQLVDMDVIRKIHRAHAGLVGEQNIDLHAIFCLFTEGIQHFIVRQEVPGADENGFFRAVDQVHQRLPDVVALPGDGEPQAFIASPQVVHIQRAAGGIAVS